MRKQYLAVAVLGVTLPFTVLQGRAQVKNSDSDSGFGITGSKKVTADDVGLPIYPGAQPYREDADSDPAVQFGAWGGSSEFRLAVLKLRANAPTSKVTAFYRQALAKYGPVLDCKKTSTASEEKDEDRLTCGNDHPNKEDGIVLKAGSNAKQHIVNLKSTGSSTVIALVFVQSADKH